MPGKRITSSTAKRRKVPGRAKDFHNRPARRNTRQRKAAPRYQDLNERQQARWHKAYQAVREMASKGISLSRAARKAGTTTHTVLKYGADWLERRGRRWTTSEKFAESQGLVDRPEPVNIITEDGTSQVTISSAEALSEYGRYLNAVKGYLHGDPDADDELAAFEGLTFTDANGKERRYITDHRLLSQLYDDGKISMEEFYAEAR